jgi:hypothetical protein
MCAGSFTNHWNCNVLPHFAPQIHGWWRVVVTEAHSCLPPWMGPPCTKFRSANSGAPPGWDHLAPNSENACYKTACQQKPCVSNNSRSASVQKAAAAPGLHSSKSLYNCKRCNSISLSLSHCTYKYMYIYVLSFIIHIHMPGGGYLVKYSGQCSQVLG